MRNPIDIEGEQANHNSIVNFEGKVALITGGSSGIGKVTARKLVKAGCKTAILARGHDRLQQAADELREFAPADSILPLVCDTTKEEMVLRAFQDTIESFGHLDIVINNAGGIETASVENTSLDQWNRMMDVHSTGYFLVAREAVRTFIKTPRPGVIIFVVSDNALKPSRDLLAYNVAKAAELHMARCIADECGRYGIRVNSVLPGAVFGESAFWTEEIRANRALTHGFNPDDLEEEYKKNTALGVIIQPEEVADLILFLAADCSRKITGAAVSIDGGGKAAFVR
jgi:NAD(P)-dependent dehydrogenase (short-subunit alcohol dehydrogenase family)